MSKALIIKGANFSTNKVETIVLSEPVPCTGITLSQNSISATTLGTIGTLTATLTPADTTDQVAWASSDETVATVVNGVVTAVGLGTATITAHCGNQSATCSVSVQSVVMSTSDLTAFIGYQMSTNKTQFESGRDYTGLSAQSTNKIVAVATPIQTESGYRAFTGDNSLYEGAYPIVIPNNAVNVSVISPSVGIEGVTMCYMDSTQQTSQVSSDKGTKVVLIPSTSWGGSPRTITFPTDVTGLDSFVLTVTFKTEIEALPNDFSVSFSAA